MWKSLALNNGRVSWAKNRNNFLSFTESSCIQMYPKGVFVFVQWECFNERGKLFSFSCSLLFHHSVRHIVHAERSLSFRKYKFAKLRILLLHKEVHRVRLGNNRFLQKRVKLSWFSYTPPFYYLAWQVFYVEKKKINWFSLTERISIS